MFLVTDICITCLSRYVACVWTPIAGQEDWLVYHSFVRSFTHAKRIAPGGDLQHAQRRIPHCTYTWGHVATGRVGNNDASRASVLPCRGKDSIIASRRYFRRPDSWPRIFPSSCRNFSEDVLIWISRWRRKKRNCGRGGRQKRYIAVALISDFKFKRKRDRKSVV